VRVDQGWLLRESAARDSDRQSAAGAQRGRRAAGPRPASRRPVDLPRPAARRARLLRGGRGAPARPHGDRAAAARARSRPARAGRARRPARGRPAARRPGPRRVLRRLRARAAAPARRRVADL
ncbi:MAG: hypothetical protein AVDCRST_MAG69-1419, partial [uncultured Solirubrobacteraceae bacterium]